MLEVFVWHLDQQSNFQSTLENHFLLISMKLIYATIGKILNFCWKARFILLKSAAYPCRSISYKGIPRVLIIGFRVPGTSLRTGKSGLIPSLYATPIESPPVAFSIYYVGTTSVSHHRGESSIMNHFYNWTFRWKCVMARSAKSLRTEKTSNPNDNPYYKWWHPIGPNVTNQKTGFRSNWSREF